VLAGNYALSGLVGRQLGGRTVGVVGTGAIGAEAARLYAGLGMKVLAYDIAPNPKVLTACVFVRSVVAWLMAVGALAGRAGLPESLSLC
jgi:phosphoglycerate dehydrogenase-like enzyme